MKKQGKGSIVNISSLAGITGSAGITPYAASKGATRTLTKGVAKDLGPHHIRVNSIQPGYINTPIIADSLANEDYRKEFLSHVPLGYIGEPEDIAYIGLFLASDESRFVTGLEFIADGGQSIRG